MAIEFGVICLLYTSTRAPRRFQRGIGVLFRNDGEFIAKRHAAQAKSDRGFVVFRHSRLHLVCPFCCLRGDRNARQSSLGGAVAADDVADSFLRSPVGGAYATVADRRSRPVLQTQYLMGHSAVEGHPSF